MIRSMKKILLAALAVSTIGCSVTAQKNNSFTSLFDGKTTNGWHTYGKNFAGKGWKAENGILHFDPKARDKDNGDLVTDKEYGNFHLKLEWKVSPKANSGIIFFVNEDLSKYNKTYLTGPEMQILDNDGHKDGAILKHRAGDLYDLIKSKSEPVKPVGEWNLAEVISNNGELTLKLNGVTTVKTMLWDENWKNLIAGSKFATWAGFGTYQKGKIALQDHGDEVWFRNIMIKEL